MRSLFPGGQVVGPTAGFYSQNGASNMVLVVLRSEGLLHLGTHIHTGKTLTHVKINLLKRF